MKYVEPLEELMVASCKPFLGYESLRDRDNRKRSDNGDPLAEEAVYPSVYQLRRKGCEKEHAWVVLRRNSLTSEGHYR